MCTNYLYAVASVCSLAWGLPIIIYTTHWLANRSHFPDDVCVTVFLFISISFSFSLYFSTLDNIFVQGFWVGRLVARLVGRSNDLTYCYLGTCNCGSNDAFLCVCRFYLCFVTLNIMHNHFADIRSLIFIIHYLYSVLWHFYGNWPLLSLSFLCVCMYNVFAMHTVDDWEIVLGRWLYSLQRRWSVAFTTLLFPSILWWHLVFSWKNERKGISYSQFEIIYFIAIRSFPPIFVTHPFFSLVLRTIRKFVW